jgi:hypothetical protein
LKTDVGHADRILSFSNPMDYFPILALDVKLQKAMGIRPEPFRDRSLQSNFFVRIEGGGPMVGKQLTGKAHHPNGENQCGNDFASHRYGLRVGI